VKNVRACDPEKLQVVYIINDIRSDGKYNTGSLPREITPKLWVINKGMEGHYGNRHGRCISRGVSKSAYPRKLYTSIYSIRNKTALNTTYDYSTFLGIIPCETIISLSLLSIL